MSTTTDTSRDAESGAPRDGDSDLGAAGSQLSTAPKEEISFPSLGPVGWVRWFWRQLTSMRVALLLLFLLSIGAIPGSLIPQTSIDPVKVDAFKADHPSLAGIYDKLGMFHVYSSVWFSAIYLLLFISLIGCIVPRTWQFVGQLRSRPPGAPRRLTRLPAYATWRTEAEPEAVLAAAQRLLKKRRFRVHRAGTAVASEKGYLRELGNLVFHVALIVMLVAFGVGSLWKSEGGKLVTEGDGFANNLTQYDDFTSGPFYDPDAMEPFGFTLDSFDATYERTGPERGTPRTFRANVTYYTGADGTEHRTKIEVNEPLDIAGSRVYLLSHGYAPQVKVKDGRGKVVYDGAVPFLTQDPKNFTSTGVVKVPSAQTKDGKRNQLGFQGFFVPTFGGKGSGSMFSTFPALDYPVLTLTAYHGDLGLDSGLSQSVYQLDQKHLKQYKVKDRKLAQMMLPGETMKLPNGDGSITFTGVKTWASFKITHQPGNGLALTGAVAALLGLAASLFIQRRRVWVRAEPGPDGITVVEIAGLGRSESARLPEELGDLAAALTPEAPVAPDAEPDAPDAEPGPDGAAPATSSGTDAAPASGPAAASPDEEAPQGPEDPAQPTDSADPADPSEGARA
ncbi:cytochrome c biogenesis protein ResB [Streptomyces benahoarensis]|uniref:Cytochrome c biogenesis protein ResB n=1 Tax=Streptomyces benahoarensis TaxID=2595054 RepID=A0A553ZPP1_9ACTN|nr:cytochrome c biogenesis protein ResB [Streptomyces benahoarensis]TSB29345.1 cytochrome c biogenesis protein ResB [Streptomyces benahoarensis]TSB43256.1 cytochrome c biogenesis protein ResB [Streptomyces benahoarensis]